MKKLLTLTLIMLMALSLVLVSCSPNANKTDDESSKQTQKLDDPTKAFLKSQFSDLSSAVQEINEIGDESSDNYTENLSFEITKKDDENPITIIDATDANSYNEGKTYKEPEATSDVNEQNNEPENNSNNVSATKYDSITFEIKYKNSKDGSGNITQNVSEKVLTFKVTGTDKEVSLSTNTTDSTYYSSSVYKEFDALLKLYCPENKSFTLDQNAIEALMKIVKQTPIITITKDFGTSDDKRVVMTANLYLSEDNGNIEINLENVDINIVETKDGTTTTTLVCSITASEESEMTLILEKGFSLGLRVVRETDDIYSLSIEKDYIKGRAVVSFSNLSVVAVWKTQGGPPTYSFAVTGSVIYNFTDDDLTMSATVKENSSSMFAIETLISFEGNLKTAEENGDWATFLKGFKIKSFKLGNYDIDPDSMIELLSTYSDKIIPVLKDLFEGTDDETDDTQKADEETKKTDSNL